MKLSEKEFLEIELYNGISFENKAFRKLGEVTAEQVKILGLKTVLDFGAGVGVYSDAFHNAGYDVVAFEIFKAHRDYMKSVVPHIKIVDEPVTTDLMLFIEVAEHMTDKELNDLFKKIKPTYILFSSTSEKTDFDAEWGHINVKAQDDWVTFFDKVGYIKVNEFGAPTTWTKLFKRK